MLATFRYQPLYYNRVDTPSGVACTQTCARTWPPLLASDASGAATPSALDGGLGNYVYRETVNGCQAEYNGHPLYRYAQDMPGYPLKPRGNAIDGRWYVVPVNIAPAVGPTPPACAGPAS